MKKLGGARANGCIEHTKYVSGKSGWQGALVVLSPIQQLPGLDCADCGAEHPIADKHYRAKRAFESHNISDAAKDLFTVGLTEDSVGRPKA